MAWTCKVASEDALRTLAETTFEALENEWQSYDVYWRRGHSFDTIIDYFALVEKSSR